MRERRGSRADPQVSSISSYRIVSTQKQTALNTDAQELNVCPHLSQSVWPFCYVSAASQASSCNFPFSLGFSVLLNLGNVSGLSQASLGTVKTFFSFFRVSAGKGHSAYLAHFLKSKQLSENYLTPYSFKYVSALGSESQSHFNLTKMFGTGLKSLHRLWEIA